jgi:hypothetical protein
MPDPIEFAAFAEDIVGASVKMSDASPALLEGAGLFTRAATRVQKFLGLGGEIPPEFEWRTPLDYARGGFPLVDKPAPNFRLGSDLRFKEDDRLFGSIEREPKSPYFRGVRMWQAIDHGNANHLGAYFTQWGARNALARSAHDYSDAARLAAWTTG